MATQSREEARLGAVAVDPRPHTHGKSSRIGMLWVLGDVLIVLAALMIAVRGWLGEGLFGEDSPYRTNIMFKHHPTILLFCLGWFILSLVLVSKRYHLYGPMQLRNTLHEQRLTIQAALTAGLLLSGALYLVRGEIISRGVVIITVVATTVLLCVRRLAWRMMMYRRFENGLEVRNIIIVGTGRVGQAMRQHLDSIRHLGYSFKGYVRIPGVDSENPAMSGEVLGTLEQLLPLARQYFADEIFLSAPCDARVVTGIVEQAREAGVDIRVVPELYDGLAWNSPIEYIGQFPTIPLHRGETPVIGLFLKRILDVLLSSVALLVLLPLLVLIALAVKLDSRGPIFYCSDRIGKKGRVFRCIKFRTMVADAERRRAEVLHMNERDGVLFKVQNDPRITGMGRFLRKYSLDELPQFVNVLRGDMSMVGPRPPIASEVKRYDLSHLRRLDVLPGMTGLWQVQARQDPSFDSYISLDTAYIQNWSIWLDIKILVRTLSVVAGGTGS
ncbi:MAG TPA: sugar transferase [Acidobacteriaceae bacterium]|nr:sugar transferase [Acidobacteriaceae bacterium]